MALASNLRGPETRVLIYGVTGSGKTTLATQLGERLGLPWFEVDNLTWEPGWTEVPLETQRERMAAICAEPGWILDTAYGKWLDIPLARATHIIALDYPRWVSLGRLLRRTITRARSGEYCCNGNRESWRQAFSSNSIVLWHLKSFHRKRERIAAFSQAGGPVVIRITRPRDLTSFLETC